MSIMEQTRSSVIESGERKPPSGPLSSLQTAPRGMIKFPTNIETVGHFMKISVLEKHKFEAELSSSPGASSLKERTYILLSMLLPMPSQLATTYAQTYDDSAAVGPLGAMAGVAMNQPGQGTRIAQALENVTNTESRGQRDLGKKQLKDMASGISGTVLQEMRGGGAANLGIQLAEENAATVGGALFGGIPGALAGDQLSRGVTAALAGAGIARNPHMAVIYKNPNFRVFNFSWELRPRTFTESLAIGRMIHTFKFYSAPSFENSSHIFAYPNQFKLSFKYPDFLFSIGTCVLKNFTVDYHGEGTPLYYEASERSSVRTFKPPAVIRISTEFQEISILTKEGIKKANR